LLDEDRNILEILQNYMHALPTGARYSGRCLAMVRQMLDFIEGAKCCCVDGSHVSDG
jgi:hypothetical protein